ncbi:MAG: nucleoside recognition domain-containing protein [Cyclonatronaceae bacterium]
MLNYIWAGLIIISLIFAVSQDVMDLVTDPYENGKEHQIEIIFPENGDIDKRQNVRFRIEDHEGTFEAVWRPHAGNPELIISVDSDMPELWLDIAEDQESRDEEEMAAEVVHFDPQTSQAAIVLPEVYYVKLRAIATAAFDMAEFAVTLAIGLIGIMALWLGLMKIADKSGLMYFLVKAVQPFMRFLFPNVPKGHAAHGVISLNLAANMLGLGNAATPLGIKAMEELQKLNPSKDKATNAQCMLLTVNTASIQLLPPATLVALIGTGVNELMISILIVTFISLVVGISAAKIYERFHPEDEHNENIPEDQKAEA